VEGIAAGECRIVAYPREKSQLGIMAAYVGDDWIRFAPNASTSARLLSDSDCVLDVKPPQARTVEPRAPGNLGDLKTRTEQIIENGASSKEIILALRAYANAGGSTLTLTEKSGAPTNFLVEAERAGSNSMIHLFGIGSDGQKHVVYRGIVKADGSVVKEHDDRSGARVAFEGSWWHHNMRTNSVVSKNWAEAADPDVAEPTDYPRRSFRNRCDDTALIDGPRYRGHPSRSYDDYERGPGYYRRPDSRPFGLGDSGITHAPGERFGMPKSERESPDPEDAPPQFSDWMAKMSTLMAMNNRGSGTSNCTRIARWLCSKFGISLRDPLSGVQQGQVLLESGLFRQVPREQARAGDLGFAHWRSDWNGLGHGFVITRRDGTQLTEVDGAADGPHPYSEHRYAGLMVLRPTMEFYRRFGKAAQEREPNPRSENAWPLRLASELRATL
jgi:hypothetical protein